RKWDIGPDGHSYSQEPLRRIFEATYDEPSKSRYDEPSKRHFEEPPRGRFDEPSRSRFDEAPRSRFDEPPRSRFDEPPRSRFDEPPKSRFDEPARSRFDELPKAKSEVKLGANDLAELAACKLNAMLGNVPGASSIATNRSSSGSKIDVAAAGIVALSRALQGAGEVTKDIEINDLKNRYLLTKGSTQADIKKETGADALQRRRPATLPSYYRAANYEILEQAVKKIDELIEQASVAPQGASSGGYTARGYSSTKMFLDFEPDKSFNVRAKIVGPQGAFVKHIQHETGCRVFLKGKGSGYELQSSTANPNEPLHLELT
ncbi:hypothetical protein BC829DRAFT_393061, partial [Chytridium lagenaria]